MNDASGDIRQQAIGMIRNALDQLEADRGVLTTRTEVQVHKAVDLLRSTPADAHLLRTAEFISCAMFEMGGFLRQGRVNAYASKALRVRKVFNASASW